ncbi:hypothetical protein D3C80_607440 [compost metagenome]
MALQQRRKHINKQRRQKQQQEDDHPQQVFLQAKFVGDETENRLKHQGKQRHAGKHQPGLLLVKLVDVMQPDREERQHRPHDEKVEKTEGPKDPKILVSQIKHGSPPYF